MKELDPKKTQDKDANLIDPSIVLADAPENSGDGGDGEERPPDVVVEN
jgi:hypothetical protein